MTNCDVAVVGAGPAGMLAAVRAAERGRATILLDKNREPGVKILLSGGTRCNLTHATDARGIVEAFGPSGRFLHSALAALGPQQVIDLFARDGVPTKIELGGKVFPASDRASDVRAALLRRVRRSGCALAMAEPLENIVPTDVGFQLVTAKRSLQASRVVLATGGQSYPACGTTGDGYRWAAAMGHRIVPPHTALAPITSHAPWCLALQGITLPDVEAEVVDSRQERRERRRRGSTARRGAMLFTHFGVSGPVVLDLSHHVSGHPCPTELVLRCDLLPTVRQEEIEAVLDEAVSKNGKRRVAALLDPWLPHRLSETLVTLSQTPLDLTAAEFSKAGRRRLADLVKKLEIPIAGTMGFRKAEVTAGGVALDQVDSRTLQSKLVPGLFFAGELLDLNGPVGGFNFQAAFSTGWLAGESV